MRPGGVTAYYLASEDIPRLLRRARWQSAEQLNTYVQEVSPLEFWTRLSPHVRWRVTWLASRLYDFIDLAVKLLQDEVPTRCWFRHFVERFERCGP